MTTAVPQEARQAKDNVRIITVLPNFRENFKEVKWWLSLAHIISRSNLLVVNHVHHRKKQVHNKIGHFIDNYCPLSVIRLPL